MIKTAILVFILIVIAVVIFYIGIYVGGMVYCKRFADILQKALDECELTSDEKIELFDKMEFIIKNQKNNEL